MTETIEFSKFANPFPPPISVGSAHTPPSLWCGNGYIWERGCGGKNVNGDSKIFTYAKWRFRKWSYRSIS